MAMNTELGWQFILDGMRYSNSNLAATFRMQYDIYERTKHLGETLPMAIEVGETPIKPLIFTTAGEQLEQLSGRLISERA